MSRSELKHRLPLRYCPFCGQNDPEITNGKEIQCHKCGNILYVNTAAAVGVILEKGDLILLAVRAKDPGKGLYDFPGGFLDPGESLEDAVIREIDEELSITPANLIYLCSFPNDYKYKQVEYSTCDVFFLASGYRGTIRVDHDEIESLKWLHPDSIDESRFAFQSHALALRKLKEIRKSP